MTGNTVEAKDIRVGDKVRVTYIYEGVVDEAESRSFHFAKFRWHNDFAPQGGTKTIEILERALPKVGDVVKGSELDRLPYLSVVLSEMGIAWQLKGGGWVQNSTHETNPYPRVSSSARFTVLHIPSGE